MNPEYKKLIAHEFYSCVERAIDRVFESPITYRPFHSALLSNEVILWSYFERSFSTSFGSRVIEEVARLVVLSNGASVAERQKEIFVDIDLAYQDQIARELRALRDGTMFLDRSFDKTLSRIMSVEPSGQKTTVRIISDLWWIKDGVNNFISLKTVKPNLDQTAVAKQDCLYLKTGLPSCNAYFGMPYNPYGESKEQYNHNMPKMIFDFERDQNVLVGKDLWDVLGGVGTYDTLLSIALEVGNSTQKLIKSRLNAKLKN